MHHFDCVPMCFFSNLETHQFFATVFVSAGEKKLGTSFSLPNLSASWRRTCAATGSVFFFCFPGPMVGFFGMSNVSVKRKVTSWL